MPNVVLTISPIDQALKCGRCGYDEGILIYAQSPEDGDASTQARSDRRALRDCDYLARLTRSNAHQNLRIRGTGGGTHFCLLCAAFHQQQ